MKTPIDMYIFGHTINSVESNFRLNCNLSMSNFIRSWALPISYYWSVYSLICIIIMTFDLELIITINLRNEFLRSELYGNVVLEICVRPLVKIRIWHYSPLLIMLIMLIMLI